VRDAEHGKPAHITRRGRAVAVVMSADDYRRLSVGSTDLWSAIEAFRQSHDLDDLDVDEVFAGVRDRTIGREVVL
jgi:prevent-host-death family protein